MKINAVRIEKTGGPEVIEWTEVELPPLNAGEVHIWHTAAGLNFIDTYQRSGLNKIPIPGGLGVEGAGVIEEIGPGVTGFRRGDHVCYPGSALPGSYSEARVIEASALVKIPEGVSDVDAAALANKGMTAEYLVRRCHKVRAGDRVLVHAAAGGTGRVLGQWLKAIGAEAIGTAGGPKKCALALSSGYAHSIDYNSENWPERVMEITKGGGVSVVYDTVGKDTFQGSLSVLTKFGLLVSVGNASGPVDGFRLNILAERGSLFITRPTLQDYIGSRKELLQSARALFKLMRGGKIKAEVGQTYKMRDAQKSHKALESRKTVGASVLLP